MLSKQAILYALIFFMASSSAMTLVHSMFADDILSMEHIIDFADSESEKEEKKTEERKINNRNLPISFRVKTNHDLLQEMMHTVDLASLYHPEITTPPPEVV